MIEMAVKKRKPSSTLGKQERAILRALLLSSGKLFTIAALRAVCLPWDHIGAPDSVCRVLRDSRKKALVWPIQSVRIEGEHYFGYRLDEGDLTPEHWEALK